MSRRNKDKPSLYALAGAVEDMDYQKKIYDYDKAAGRWKVVDHCKAFRLWLGVLVRCYDPDFKKKRHTYAECFMDSSWLKFSVFKAWYDDNRDQALNNLDLDKDILVYGNKMYGPDTCSFVPRYINSLLHHTVGGSVMLGVSKRKMEKWCKTPPKKAWRAWVYVDGKNKSLGSYATEFEAHREWQLGKADQIENILLKYMLDPSYNQRVANSLYLRAEMLRLDFENNVETKLL